VPVRVYICNLPDVTQHSAVVHIPYIYGVLRGHAEQHEEVRASFEFAPPLWQSEPPDQTVERFDNPAIVGFSTYIWNERNTHRLARALKKRFPSCLIVFGGPQIPNNPSDYLHKHPWVDLLVHGEGEPAFTDLLRQYLRPQTDWSLVPGVSFLVNGEQTFSATRSLMSQLDLPSPYVEGYFDAMIEEVRAQNPHATLMACMETNRGCPYSCSFCDWGMATMSKLRRYTEERVKAEFEWASRHQLQGIILNDANFGILPRDVELARYVAELKADTGYPRNFYPLGLAKNNKDRAFAVNKIIIDNEFDPFGMNVNFSLQATSQTTLDAIQRQNIPLENYRSLADRYAQEGYQLTPDLILPLPGETLESFQDGYADLASWEHVCRIRIYPCGILPNAPMAAPAYREKWGLVTRMVPLGSQPGLQPGRDDVEVELIETVIATSTMSEAEHSQAKVFVALVNALELYGLTRAIRGYTERVSGLTAGQFYRKFWLYQIDTNGTLASGLASIAAPVLGRTYSDELIGSGAAYSHDGKLLRHHKVLAYDALTRPQRFQNELSNFLAEMGLGPPEELIRYQADRWILPDYDPHRTYRYSYRWDWHAYLGGEATLTQRPLEIEYPHRPSWLEYGYQPGLAKWQSFALAVNSVDTHCVHLPGRVLKPSI
jgi:2-(S-pantetheinyl)-carbapenam-3-carboxylate methyltransferase